MFLNYFIPVFKRDKDVVNVEQVEELFVFAHPLMRADKDVVLAAALSFPEALMQKLV